MCVVWLCGVCARVFVCVCGMCVCACMCVCGSSNASVAVLHPLKEQFISTKVKLIVLPLKQISQQVSSLGVPDLFSA